MYKLNVQKGVNGSEERITRELIRITRIIERTPSKDEKIRRDRILSSFTPDVCVNILGAPDQRSAVA
jgi:hypothetical protein